MATVVVNRLEIEPASSSAEATPEAAPAQPPAPREIPPRELERALRSLQIRRARVEAC